MKEGAPEELSLKRFELQYIIGQGAFGKVKTVMDKKSKKQYALKYINKEECIEGRSTINIFRERLMLQTLCHPYIIGLRFAFQDDIHLFMILEYAKGGDLRFNMGKQATFDSHTIMVWAAQLSYAIDYMHEQKIIHRDLKPENLLLDDLGNLYITDLNIAVSVEKRFPSSESGTLDYMAPEMFTGQPYGFSIDWWATGTIIYECIYKKRPFRGGDSNEEVKDAIISKPLKFSDKTVDGEPVQMIPVREQLLEQLLERDVSKRLGSANNGRGFETEVKAHEYFSKIDWSLIAEKKLLPNYHPNNDKDAMNFQPNLLIEEMINGGSDVSYRPRKKKRDPNKKTLGEKIAGSFSSLFSKSRSDNSIAQKAAKVKSRKEIELEQMEEYFVPFDYELPSNPEMNLPPDAKKEKKDEGSAGSIEKGAFTPERASPLRQHDDDDSSMHSVDSAGSIELAKKSTLKNHSPLRDGFEPDAEEFGEKVKIVEVDETLPNPTIQTQTLPGAQI
ncbi:hypothetical protein HDV01_000537 [Terramyces sp. JEL0728]|nr:hypothetical protein HDV01_000537 [Terramyces sp. JEL0728]